MRITIFGLSIPQVIGVFVVLAVIGGIINFFSPQRSVENYCKTFKAEGEKLHKQWEEQSKQTASQGDDFGKFIGSVSTLAGMPRDLENFFDKLSKVAPEDIEPDVVTLKEAVKKSADIPMSGNLIQGFASSIMLGLSTAGAQSRVNAYTAKHCDLGQQTSSNSLANSYPTVSRTSQTPIAKIPIVTPSITNSPVHAMLALSPNPITVKALGTGSVDVNIYTGGHEVTAVQLELSYDPNIITNVKVNPTQLIQNPVMLVQKIDEAQGKIVSAFGIIPNHPTIQGTGVVATISFATKNVSGKESKLELLPTSQVTARGLSASVLRDFSGTNIIVK